MSAIGKFAEMAVLSLLFEAFQVFDGRIAGRFSGCACSLLITLPYSFIVLA